VVLHSFTVVKNINSFEIKIKGNYSSQNDPELGCKKVKIWAPEIEPRIGPEIGLQNIKSFNDKKFVSDNLRNFEELNGSNSYIDVGDGCWRPNVLVTS